MPDGGASIWLPILIGGAMGTADTVIGSVASGKAADTQAAYGQQALALEKAMYGEAVARSQPTITAGNNATNALSTLMGLGTGGPLGGTPNPGQPGGVMPPSALPPGASSGAPPVIDTRTISDDRAEQEPTPAWNPLTTLMSQPSTNPTRSPFGAPTANQPPAQAGTMVMMVSPDGKETQAVPQNMVSLYQRRGATIAPGAAA